MLKKADILRYVTAQGLEYSDLPTIYGSTLIVGGETFFFAPYPFEHQLSDQLVKDYEIKPLTPKP